jgi:hypothetical protein
MLESMQVWQMTRWILHLRKSMEMPSKCIRCVRVRECEFRCVCGTFLVIELNAQPSMPEEDCESSVASCGGFWPGFSELNSTFFRKFLIAVKALVRTFLVTPKLSSVSGIASVSYQSAHTFQDRR